MRKQCGPLWAAIFFIAGSAPASGEPAKSIPEVLQTAEHLLLTDKDDPQLHFIRGMALAELARYAEAAEEFRWMLAYDPALHRPRLELARVLMLLGQHDAARYNFEQVLASDLPEDVRRNISSLLARIRERTATLLTSVELVSDSNPNQATSSDEVEIRGLRYKVNNDGRPTKSTGIRMTLDGKLPLGDESLWFLRSNAEVQEYSNSRVNFRYVHVAGGRHFHSQDQTLTLEAGNHASEYGGKRLYDGSTMAISDYRQIRNDLGAKFGAAAQQLNYLDYAHLSGWQRSLTAQAFYAPSPTSRWEVTAGIMRYSAKEAAYGFEQHTFSGRYIQEWVGGWITGLSLGGIQSRYGGTDPIFLERRMDHETKAELELSNRRVRLWKLTPRLQIGWSDRESNINFYGYRRAYVRIGMVGDF
jgi:hypothetical protein